MEETLPFEDQGWDPQTQSAGMVESRGDEPDRKKRVTEELVDDE
jgi:hypothetical protein